MHEPGTWPRIPRVLVVEDNVDIGWLLCHALRGAGWTTDLAARGDLALDRLGPPPPGARGPGPAAPPAAPRPRGPGLPDAGADGGGRPARDTRAPAALGPP